MAARSVLLLVCCGLWCSSLVSAACTGGVTTAAGLTTAVANAPAGAVTPILICSDLQLNATVYIKNSVSITGGCGAIPCRITAAVKIQAFNVVAGASSLAVSFQDLSFSGFNTPTSEGSTIQTGAIASLTITSCTFSGNTAQKGVVFTDAAKVTVTDSIFNSNRGMEYSGGVYVRGVNTTSTSLLISGSWFNENVGGATGNTVPGQGGAIIVGNHVGNGYVLGNNFTGNRATEGGAVYIQGVYGSNFDIQISGNLFQRNTAQKAGGAVYLFESGSKTVLASNKFDSNTSPNGGAVYSIYSFGTSLCSNTFTNNSSPLGADAYIAKNDANHTGSPVSFCPALSTGTLVESQTGSTIVSCTGCTCAPETCSPLATCTTTGSGPSCACPAGYRGNGFSCSAIPVPTPSPTTASNSGVVTAAPGAPAGNTTPSSATAMSFQATFATAILAAAASLLLRF